MLVISGQAVRSYVRLIRPLLATLPGWRRKNLDWRPCRRYGYSATTAAAADPPRPRGTVFEYRQRQPDKDEILYKSSFAPPTPHPRPSTTDPTRDRRRFRLPQFRAGRVPVINDFRLSERFPTPSAAHRNRTALIVRNFSPQ